MRHWLQHWQQKMKRMQSWEMNNSQGMREMQQRQGLMEKTQQR
jgi:hypothetical protein